nr:AAA family ATPase [Nocardiopsis mwathae]
MPPPPPYAVGGHDAASPLMNGPHAPPGQDRPGGPGPSDGGVGEHYQPQQPQQAVGPETAQPPAYATPESGYVPPWDPAPHAGDPAAPAAPAQPAPPVHGPRPQPEGDRPWPGGPAPQPPSDTPQTWPGEPRTPSAWPEHAAPPAPPAPPGPYGPASGAQQAWPQDGHPAPDWSQAAAPPYPAPQAPAGPPQAWQAPAPPEAPAFPDPRHPEVRHSGGQQPAPEPESDPGAWGPPVPPTTPHSGPAGGADPTGAPPAFPDEQPEAAGYAPFDDVPEPEPLPPLESAPAEYASAGGPHDLAADEEPTPDRSVAETTAEGPSVDPMADPTVDPTVDPALDAAAVPAEEAPQGAPLPSEERTDQVGQESASPVEPTDPTDPTEPTEPTEADAHAPAPQGSPSGPQVPPHLPNGQSAPSQQAPHGPEQPQPYPPYPGPQQHPHPPQPGPPPGHGYTGPQQPYPAQPHTGPQAPGPHPQGPPPQAPYPGRQGRPGPHAPPGPGGHPHTGPQQPGPSSAGPPQGYATGGQVPMGPNAPWGPQQQGPPGFPGPPGAPGAHGPQTSAMPHPDAAHPFQYRAHIVGDGEGQQGAGETSDMLDADSLVRNRPKPQAKGWRKVVQSATFGLVNPGESANEVRRRELTARATTHVAGGHHRVAVLSLKGGVGKTTTTVALGSMLASLRGDRVLAVDANPDRGTLSDKVRLQTAATIRDLLNERDTIRRYADIRGFTSQAASRLEILASDRDPAVSEAFSEEDYRQVTRILEHYYSICLTDCGTGLLHSAMRGVLGLADQVVLVSSASVDGARSASATLDWLEAHEYGYLVRGAVVVLSMVRTDGKSTIDLDRLEQHFASRCRAVVRVPWDPHLEEGAEVDLDRLHPSTRDAYLQLAATVGEAFAWPR